MSRSDVRIRWRQVRRYYQHVKPGRYLLPVPGHDLLYVKNPKAGSSTLVGWLDRLHTGDLDADLAHMHQEHRLPTLAQVGRPAMLEMLSGGAYRFSFVRHPLRRLESVYRAKMFRDLKFRRRVAPSLGIPADPSHHVSFEEFLAAIEVQDPLTEMDPHWRPQHLNLLHPVVTYDFVGRLETFESDVARIEEEAGLPHVPMESRNVAPRAVSESVFDGRPDLARRAEQVYATDLELYGY